MQNVSNIYILYLLGFDILTKLEAILNTVDGPL